MRAVRVLQRRRRTTLLFVLVSVMLAMAVTRRRPAVPAEGPSPCGLTTAPVGAGQWEHVALVVFENKAVGQILGNTTDAPYLNQLATGGASYHGIDSLR